MKKIVFFILFIFKSIFSSQIKQLDQMTKEDIVRKHFYLLLQKKPSITPEQLREIHFRALSFDEKNEESFIFQSDVYFLREKLKKENCFDDSGNNSIVKDYLIQLRKDNPNATYKYIKNVKEAALSKKEIDKEFELKLRAFDLYKELKELKYL